MKILILSHFYPPEMGAAATRLHALARWLVRFGHQVTVLTGFPNYPSGVVPHEYRRKLYSTETLEGVEILRTWIYASPRRGSGHRLANYFSYVLSSSLAGLFRGRSYDIILASSPPLFIGLAAVLLSRVHRIPTVLDIRDIWPDVAVEAGEFSPQGRLTRWGGALARFLYGQVNHVTPVTNNKRQKLLAAHVPPSKLTVVTNGVDLDRTIAQAGTDLPPVPDLANKFVVLYAGLIGIAQGVDIAVKAADLLSDHDDIHFLIVGDGVRREALVADVERRRLTNVTWLPQQPPATIPAFMRRASVCLVPLVSSNLVDAVPSKLLEAWAYQKPVILAAGGEAADIVRASGGGVVVSPEEPKQLAEAVVALRDQPEQLRAYAQAGHRYVQNHFDRPVLARQMETVLQQVVEQARDRQSHGAAIS